MVTGTERMSSGDQKSNLVRTIRLDEAELNTVLDRLDSKEPAPKAQKRVSERFSYRTTGCIVHMQQPGAASATAYQVATRNLSAGGMSFLHGGYVHTGTKVLVQLISTYGTWKTVRATAVVCEYVNGNIHDVGVKFDQEIEPGDFCTAAIRSRVLIVDDDDSLAKLATYYLGKLNAEVDRAENGEVGVEMASKNKYDLILMDVEMPVMDGHTAVRELRSKGYIGKIIAATGRTEEEDRVKCLEAGCDGYIPKPYVQDDLATVLASIEEEPLISSHQDDPDMIPLIESYVETLPEKVRCLEVAMAKGDADKLESLARSAKSDGKSFGFDPISESAAKLESSIKAGTELEALRGQLDELAHWCQLARA